jgi:hypothetical protein
MLKCITYSGRSFCVERSPDRRGDRGTIAELERTAATRGGC